MYEDGTDGMKTEAKEPNSGIRQPTCAGRFYPVAPTELRERIEICLLHAQPSKKTCPKAIVAPHAGYQYSGSVAASAYLPWRGMAEGIRCVVLAGPSHHMDFDGIALSSANAFATPLGDVPVDQEAMESIRGLPRVRVIDSAHEREHCLEVQLPFLQTLLGGFSIVPLLVGKTEDGELMTVLELLWGDLDTRVVVSSDLSHYHDYPTAVSLDAATALAIEQLDAGILDGDHACGFRAIRGLMGMARRHGLSAFAVDLRNSGDTAGPRDRVVGYGAFLFGEP